MSPTEGHSLPLARGVADRLWWPAPRRGPLLSSERERVVKWVIIIETWYYRDNACHEQIEAL